MQLNIIGTGSSGNCYALQAGGQTLLLDAGLPIRRIQRSVSHWEYIVGCLVTHEHMDHTKAAADISKRGIQTLMTHGTLTALEGDSDFCLFQAVKMRSTVSLGEFTVMPFETQHDASEPCGWLIRFNPTGEIVLYATDTYYLAYTFPGINYWIVECNFMEELVKEQIADDRISNALRGRLIKSHMSLRRLTDALTANDLSCTRAIILVHLSDERSDEKCMVDTIREASGVADVFAAKAGMEISLELTPF